MSKAKNGRSRKLSVHWNVVRAHSYIIVRQSILLTKIAEAERNMRSGRLQRMYILYTRGVAWIGCAQYSVWSRIKSLCKCTPERIILRTLYSGYSRQLIARTHAACTYSAPYTYENILDTNYF